VAVQLTLMAGVAASGLAGLVGLAGPAWSGWPRMVTSVVGLVLIVAAATLFWRGWRDLSDNLTAFPKPLETARLVDTGAYALVRHPLYGALVFIGVGWALFSASPVTMALAGLLTIFADMKARREEVWLMARYDSYGSYRARTHRLIPWLY